MTIRLVIVDDELPARARLKRLLATKHDVEIVAADKAAGGTDQLQLNVTAKTYRYLDEEEQAAQQSQQQQQQTGRKRPGKPPTNGKPPKAS